MYPPPPREGFAYHLGDRIPPKQWLTILLEICHCNTSNDVQTNANQKLLVVRSDTSRFTATIYYSLFGGNVVII